MSAERKNNFYDTCRTTVPTTFVQARKYIYLQSMHIYKLKNNEMTCKDYNDKCIASA